MAYSVTCSPAALLVSPIIVIPGRTEGASPEPMNTGLAVNARCAGGTFAECGVPGFRALGFAEPRNDDGGVEAYFATFSPAAPSRKHPSSSFRGAPKVRARNP